MQSHLRPTQLSTSLKKRPRYKTVEAAIPAPEPAPAPAPIAEPEPVETVVYEAESPETYIVQEGDTLWDISTVFLRDPWFWPEIWFKNPQVENPHLIYPGDTLAIVYIGGERKVQVLSRGTEGSVLSQTEGGLESRQDRSPHSLQLDRCHCPVDVPIDSIRHLLERPLVMDTDTRDNSAYVLSQASTTISSTALTTSFTCASSIPRKGLAVTRSTARTALCTTLLPMNCWDTMRFTLANPNYLLRGDPASIRVTQSEREILRDDIVLPIDNTNFERDFHPPTTEHPGQRSRSWPCWMQSRKPAYIRPLQSTLAFAMDSKAAIS